MGSRRGIYPLFLPVLAAGLCAAGLVFTGVFHALIPLGALLLATLFFSRPHRVLAIGAVAGLAGGVAFGLIYLLTRDLSAALSTLYRFLVLGGAAIPLAAFSSADLSACLDTLKVSRSISLPLTIFTSFIPRMMAERRILKMGYRTRGMKRPFFAASLAPLIVRMSEMSDDITRGLLTRGFTLGKPPVNLYAPRRIGIRDVLYALICLVALGAIVGIGLWLR